MDMWCIATLIMSNFTMHAVIVVMLINHALATKQFLIGRMLLDITGRATTANMVIQAYHALGALHHPL